MCAARGLSAGLRTRTNDDTSIDRTAKWARGMDPRSSATPTGPSTTTLNQGRADPAYVAWASSTRPGLGVLPCFSAALTATFAAALRTARLRFGVARMCGFLLVVIGDPIRFGGFIIGLSGQLRQSFDLCTDGWADQRAPHDPTQNKSSVMTKPSLPARAVSHV